MTKTYLATKQEVVTISNDLQTLDSQVNTATTGIAAQVSTLATNKADADGWVPNRVMTADAAGNLAESAAVSTSDLNSLSSSSVDSAVTIDDADMVVHNDAGVMKQTSFTRIWAWIVSKAVGAVSSILTTNLTANRALASNAAGKVVASAATETELSYLVGATSSVQTQLNQQKSVCKAWRSDTSSATWTQLFSLGGVAISARYTTASALSLRIANNTGASLFLLVESTAGASSGATEFSQETLSSGSNIDYTRSTVAANFRHIKFSTYNLTEDAAVNAHEGSLMLYYTGSGVRVNARMNAST